MLQTEQVINFFVKYTSFFLTLFHVYMDVLLRKIRFTTIIITKLLYDIAATPSKAANALEV